MGDYETLQMAQEEGILTLSLNRPDRLNAVNDVLHRELSLVFEEIATEPAVQAVVFTGAGRAFCAGGDIRWLQGLHRNSAAIDRVMREGRKIIEDMLRLEVPLIAAVNGDAIGLGATLALFCDVIYAAETAHFADPHVRVGLAAGDGGAVIWPALVGVARAKELLLTGDRLTAQEAARYGLVNRVLPAAEVLGAAHDLARRLASGAALAIRATKRAINKRLQQDVNLILELSLSLEAATMQSDDFLEATTAFLEKREPRLRGR